MPIRDLPRTFRRLGKIRLGEQLPVMDGAKQKISKTGAPVFRPAKLERFRLTSPDQVLLEHAAEVYGGEVREWAGAPGDGDQWELYVTSPALDVVIPPQLQSEEGGLESGSFQQWYELWSGGGCLRRCDGVTETISGQPCSAMSPACPVDHEARRAAAANGKACKMTTRIMVLLPKLPDLGVWMLESHGWYAAVELGGFMEFLARRAPGEFVNGLLVPEARTVKRAGKTNNFVVPVIKLPHATAGELLAGAPAPAALDAGSTAGVVTDAERVRTFVIACSDRGWDDDVRHAIVGYATKGRTRSSREVAPDEWMAVEAVVRWYSDGKLVTVTDQAGDVVLVKPGQGPATTGPIAVQSREAPPDDPGPGDADDMADDWDRMALVARMGRLDVEHMTLFQAACGARGIALGTPLTKEQDDAASALIGKIERDADTKYADRRKRAEVAMKAVGVTTADGRADLLRTLDATADIKRLTPEQFEAVMVACDNLAASDETGEKAS